MQFAKDSFYMALRERLAGLNPQRTVTVNGVVRPAILVLENEMPTAQQQLPDAFYLQWAGASVLPQHCGGRVLMKMECGITYVTRGSSQTEIDRGRCLGELDIELLSICQPSTTEKQDFSASPSVDLGSTVFWTLPILGDWKLTQDVAESPSAGGGTWVGRKATIEVFVFPEVSLV